MANHEALMKVYLFEADASEHDSEHRGGPRSPIFNNGSQGWWRYADSGAPSQPVKTRRT